MKVRLNVRQNIENNLERDKISRNHNWRFDVLLANLDARV